MTANPPNMAGKAMTVRGPIDPDQLGITLMHEHLFVATTRTYMPDDNTPATDWWLWQQELTMDKLDLTRARRPIMDNWFLADEQTAIDEATEFRNLGGGTLLGHGVYIEFDLMGRVGVPMRYVPDGDDLRSFMSSAGTAAVAEAIPRLMEAGYVDRILLSQDVSAKMQLKKYGGTGYSFIMEKFLPELRSRGVSEEHIQTMMVGNPKRILTFVEPQA